LHVKAPFNLRRLPLSKTALLKTSAVTCTARELHIRKPRA